MRNRILCIAILAVFFCSSPLTADDKELQAPAETPEPGAADDTEKPYEIKPEALVHIKYEWEPEEQEDGQDLDLSRARIGLRVSYEKFVQAKVEFDARADDILKNGWIKLRFLRELKLKAGFFKRPFLKIRMRSPHNIETINRGAIDRTLKYGMDYTSHKTGAALEGKVFKKAPLRYKVGVFPDFQASRGVVSSNDLVAMVSVRPVKKLEIGAAGEIKFLTSDEAHADMTVAANLFFDADIKHWHALVEGVVGQDPRFVGTPLFFGGIGMVSYTFDIMSAKPLVGIRPVIKGEVMEPDVEIVDDIALMGTAGVDLLLVYNVRFGIDAEYHYAQRNNRDGEENEFVLLALLGWEL